MKAKNLLGMDFCQDQIFGIHLDWPGIELRQPPKSFYNGSLQQNEKFPDVPRIPRVRLLYTMHVDAKSARCGKYLPGDPKFHFLPGLIFQPNREAVSIGSIFVDIMCFQSEPTLLILIESYKNHQVTLAKGRTGFFPEM